MLVDPHLINWSIAYSDKKFGGLSIKNLSTINKANLGKWSRRFAIEGESLWESVIAQKLGRRAWSSKGVRIVMVWACGRAIRNRWESFMSRSHFMVAMEEE